MDEFQKAILNEMNLLQKVFKTQRIIETPDKRHAIEIVWVSKQAQDYYESLRDILEYHEQYKGISEFYTV